jgi:hypothetical protein
MPLGKPAHTRCVQLDGANRCLLFESPERPEVCRSLRPHLEMCGNRDSEAFSILTELESLTRPSLTS